jgi:hypothetical protein
MRNNYDEENKSRPDPRLAQEAGRKGSKQQENIGMPNHSQNERPVH